MATPSKSCPANIVATSPSGSRKQLTIRGIGERPVLIADGKKRRRQSHLGHPQWRHSASKTSNSAAARVSTVMVPASDFEHGKLTVRNCVFIDNQTGILTSNFDDVEFNNRKQLYSPSRHDETMRFNICFTSAASPRYESPAAASNKAIAAT